MTKRSVIFAFVAAAVALDSASAANLRIDRFMAITETSESGSADFLFDGTDASGSAIGERFPTEVDGSVDGSGYLGSREESNEGGSVERSFVEDEASEDIDDESSDAVDPDDSEDDSDRAVTSPYQPDPTDVSTGGSQEFDKSKLTWWK